MKDILPIHKQENSWNVWSLTRHQQSYLLQSFLQLLCTSPLALPAQGR